MKKTIFGFVCTILMSFALSSCEGNANADKVSASDTTEVVADSVSVDTVAVDSVA